MFKNLIRGALYLDSNTGKELKRRLNNMNTNKDFKEAMRAYLIRYGRLNEEKRILSDISQIKEK